MAAALSLARRNLGQVWPNPAVGCLIVDPHAAPPRIVGRGWTGRGGRPHAETAALAEAGPSARGATAYVTLEPCAHHGQTPPCCEALIGAGIARVVSALEDPDPRVSGRGHTALKMAGLTLDVGCLAEEAAQLNAGFLSRIRLGRPHVTLKLAVSRDCMIAARPGARTAITGEAANARVHMMRALSDAVLVGAGTLAADDPELTCRLPGMADRSPVRVVVDADAQLSPSSRLMTTIGQAPVWLMAGASVVPARHAALEAVGIRVIGIEPERGALLDLPTVLRELGRAGITRLLVEGGARIAESMIDADLIDEATIFTAPRDLGPNGVPALGRYPLGILDDETRFLLVTREAVGADTVSIFWRRR